MLVSEAMLQQTQVATVIPYFGRFIERFPTLWNSTSYATDGANHVLRTTPTVPRLRDSSGMSWVRRTKSSIEGRRMGSSLSSRIQPIANYGVNRLTEI